MLKPRGITSQGGIVHYKSPAFIYLFYFNPDADDIPKAEFAFKLDFIPGNASVFRY